MKAKVILLMVVSGIVGGIISNVFMMVAMPNMSCLAQTVSEQTDPCNIPVADIIRAKRIEIVNDREQIVLVLGGTPIGGALVMLNNEGEPAAGLTAGENGGNFGIHNSEGELAAGLTADEDGGHFSIYNKTNEEVIKAYADEYGNGVVGAYNRQGRGRTLRPGN